MATRAVFNSSLLNYLKRAGARFQTNEPNLPISEAKFPSEFAKQRQAVKHHARESAETWKRICLFVCVPTLLASGLNAYHLAREHEEHLKEHPREFVPYEYRNWRVKDFFWGKQSLFFNPKVNHPVPEE